MHWLVLGVHPALGRHIHLQTTEREVAWRRLQLVAEARDQQVIDADAPPEPTRPRVELRHGPERLVAWAPLQEIRP